MSYKSMFQDVRDAVDWVHFKVKFAQCMVVCFSPKSNFNVSLKLHQCRKSFFLKAPHVFAKKETIKAELQLGN